MNLESISSVETSKIHVDREQEAARAISESAVKVSSVREFGEADRKKADSAASPYEESTLQEAVDKVNTIMNAMNKDLEFEIDERLDNYVVVKVVDKDSGEVIRQYPPEEMLNVMARLEETILGVLVDDRA